MGRSEPPTCFRLGSLLGRLDAAAADLGVTRTAWLRRAVSVCLDHPHVMHQPGLPRFGLGPIESDERARQARRRLRT